MSLLLTLHGLSKSYGTQDLFENISFTLSEGDRIGLIGPNGAGKSTLLEIMMGMEDADAGHVSKKQGLRIGYASQSPEFPDVSVEDVLILPFPKEDPDLLRTRARILLGKAQFTDFSQSASSLSGGWKKRLDIARALMQEPELLLLDEPTNHLDLEGILWLEKFLLREKIAYLVISHDRYFLENAVNKVIELNKCYPQGLFISGGGMSSFILHREAFLQGQAQQERSLASLVREEVEWLRKSPKARTTKSQSRIDRAHGLIEELSNVKQRNVTRKVGIDFSASERETRKLLVANNLGVSRGGKELFKGLDLVLSPGSRLGIVGTNGTGKTTLLKVLSGALPQQMGTIKYADDLKIVYFDQHREQISDKITLKEALSPTGEMVNYRGQWIHVNGWAKKFLFRPDRLELPVGCLSGGEKARINIAKLMLEPADILFLDEPTNDLDIQTLEVIEESLQEFAGAVVLISHDRCLMDKVCTQILGLGLNLEQRFFADFSQWEEASSEKQTKKEAVLKTEVKETSKPQKQKLTYKEQKELEGMENNILALENKIAELQEELDDPAVHSDSSKSMSLYEKLAEAQQQLEASYKRWQFLDEKVP